MISNSHSLALTLEGANLPFPDPAFPETFFTDALFATPGIKLGGNLNQLTTFYGIQDQGQLGALSQDGYIMDFKLASVTVRPTSVPEPGTFALFGIGLIGLRLVRRAQQA